LVACAVSPEHLSLSGEGLAAFVDASGTISTHDVRKAFRSDGKMASARRNFMRAEFEKPPAVAAQVQDIHNVSLSKAVVNASSNASSNESFAEDLDAEDLDASAVGLKLKSVYDPVMCIDQSKNGRKDIYVWKCHNGHNQKWYFDGWKIKNGQYNTKCLDHHGSGKLGLAECRDVLSQAWYWSGTSLKSKSSNDTCMESGSGRRRRQTAGGAKLQMAPCKQSNKQEWYFLSEYKNRVISAQKDPTGQDECLEGGSTPGSSLHMATCHTGNREKMYFDGDHLEMRGGAHKCIKVHNSKVTSTNECHTGKQQRWKIEGQKFVNKEHGQCLEWSNANRKELNMNPCNSNDNQKWILLEALEKVTIGEKSSGSAQSKCVKRAHMNCSRNAGDKGIRVNGDHKNAGDSFIITTTADKVCAERTDSGQKNWGMFLRIVCTSLTTTTTTQVLPPLPTATSPAPSPPNFIPDMKSASYLKTRYDDKCVWARGGVRAASCRNDRRKLWYFNAEAIKSKFNPWYCLAINSGGRMGLHRCSSTSNQKFFFDGESIKTYDGAYSNKCMDYDYLITKTYGMQPCTGSSNQRFYFYREQTQVTTTTTTYVEPGHLRGFTDSGSKLGCLDRHSRGQRQLFVNSQCKNVGNQKFYVANIPGETGFFSIKNLAGTYAGRRTDLCLGSGFKMKSCNAGDQTQKFKFVGQLLKDHRDLCLDASTNNALNWKTCDSSASQNWKFEKDPACDWNEWGAWSACSAQCGGGVKVMKRSTKSVSAFGYSPCKPATGIDEDKCNMTRCGTPCQWTNFSKWGTCSKPCGGGTHTRTRTVAVPAKFGGAACEGNTSESQACNTQHCPVDCEMGIWTSWTICSKPCGTGKNERTREPVTKAQFGGKECKEPTVEKGECNTHACPGDCEWGEFGSWSLCTKTCGNGTQTAVRPVKTPATHGGKDCEGSNTTTRHCNTQHCKVNCEWSEWENWPTCGVTCGGAKRERSRNKTKLPAYGGDACEGSSKEEEHCNIGGCPVNCEWSEWQSYGNCSKTCGGGFKERKRIKAKEKAFNGDDCVGNATEKDVCNPGGCPVDCALGEWQEWSTCSKECDGGAKTRKRNVTQFAKFAGNECVGVKEETKPCNTQGCPHDCKYGDWSAWPNCTKTCGGGQMVRTRQVTQNGENGGTICQEKLEDSQECNSIKCPVDCVWKEWNPWSPCSSTCEGGMHNRTRNQTKAVGSGKACDETEKPSEEQPCNAEVKCPIDCKLMEWDPWQTCSVTCGQGKRKRTRIIQEGQYNGKPCSDNSSEEEVSCYGVQVDCNDSSITLEPTTTTREEAVSANGGTTSETPSTTEVLKGGWVTGNMQLQTDDVSDFMNSDAAKDAVKDTIAELGKCNETQVEVKFTQMSGDLLEVGQKAARGKGSEGKGTINVQFSIKLNATEGVDLSSKGAETASELTNDKLTEATKVLTEQCEKHEVKKTDKITFSPEVVGLEASVGDEGLAGTEEKEERGVWPEELPAHAATEAATTTTVHSASCRPSETWRLVWTTLLVIAVVASQEFQR